MKLIIDIPEEAYKTICDKYATFPKEMKEWGLEAIKNGKPIPNNVTNGDVIKAMFPDAEITFFTTLSGTHTVAVDFEDNTLDLFYCPHTFNLDWWNSRYQKGGKDRRNCEHRHENGNCLAVGGFCTSVDDEYCVKGGK